MQEFKAHAAQMPVQGYLNLDTQIFNFGLNAVEFLVAGLDDSGAHLFRIYYNGVAGGDWMEWCDKLGYRAIGSGSSHATIWLSLEGQHRGLSVPDTLFNLYCAKKTAESAPGVGRETDLFFLTANGVERVPEPVFAQFDKVRDSTKKAPDGDELQRIYEKRNGQEPTGGTALPTADAPTSATAGNGRV